MRLMDPRDRGNRMLLLFGMVVLPIWCWLVCQYVFRLLFMGVFGGIVLFFSARLKNVFLMVISMSLFILTAAFFYL